MSAALPFGDKGGERTVVSGVERRRSVDHEWAGADPGVDVRAVEVERLRRADDLDTRPVAWRPRTDSVRRVGRSRRTQSHRGRTETVVVESISPVQDYAVGQRDDDVRASFDTHALVLGRQVIRRDVDLPHRPSGGMKIEDDSAKRGDAPVDLVSCGFAPEGNDAQSREGVGENIPARGH